MQSKEHGFSLIELMIVIAIVGILAAVAIPAYSTYIVKSKLSNAMTSLEFFKKIVIEDATMKGTVQNSVATESGSLTTATALAVKSAPVTHIFYNVISPKQFYLCASSKELGIDGGVDPTSGNDGIKNRLCVMVIRDSGVFGTQCGNLNSVDVQNIPNEFLPNGCNCKDITTPAC